LNIYNEGLLHIVLQWTIRRNWSNTRNRCRSSS